MNFSMCVMLASTGHALSFVWSGGKVEATTFSLKPLGLCTHQVMALLCV